MKKKVLALALVLILMLNMSNALAFEWLLHYDESQYDWLLDTSPITIEIRTADTSVYDDETCKSIATLAAATGVTIKRTSTGDSDGTGLTLALAAGELPDIIVTEASADYLNNFMAQAIATDSIWALDDLIELYAPHFKELVDPEQFTEFQWEDGKTYKFVNAITTARYLEARSLSGSVGTPAANLIRQDWYDEIGRPDMTTPDSFVEALKKIQENHPECYGWVGPTDNWSSPYSQFSAWFGKKGYHVDENHQVHDDAFTAEAREAAMFANRLYLEGLLTKEDILDSFDVQANVFAGKVACYKWNTAEDGKQVDGTDTCYRIIRPFTSFATYSNSSIGGGWKAIMISKNCKNPDRAIRLLEFMVSQEGSRVLYWGIEGPKPEDGGAFNEEDYAAGPHYFINDDGRPTFYAGYIAAQNADWDGSHKKAGLHELWYGENNLYNNMVNWDTSSDFEKLKSDYYGGKVSIPMSQFAIKIPSFDEDLQEISSRIKQIKKNYVASVVFADSAEEANANYDTMLREIIAAGEEKLSACYTEQYIANCQRLGIDP